MQNQYFRILALSATPGNKMDNVHEVRTLNIIKIIYHLNNIQYNPLHFAYL